MNKLYLFGATVLIVAFTILIYWFKPESNTNQQSLDIVQMQERTTSNNIQNTNNENLSNEDLNIDNKVSENDQEKGFVTPNTNWPNREINGVTYVFGEGNPKEVSLAPSEYTGDGKWRNYITPESEAYLKSFLENKSLKDFVDKCGGKLNLTNNNTMAGFNITESEDLDINKLLVIDPNTGRKQFDEDKIYGISQLLYSVTSELDGNSAITSCMNGREIEEFEQLYADYNKMTESYINQPTDAFYDQNNPDSLGYDIIQYARKMMGISNN